MTVATLKAVAPLATVQLYHGLFFTFTYRYGNARKFVSKQLLILMSC